MLRLHPLLCRLLLGILASAFSAAWPLSPASAAGVPHEVDARVQSRGKARVIVEYGSPGFSPGVRRQSAAPLDGDAVRHAGERLEAKMAAARRSRAGQRAQPSLRIRRFQDLPLVALEADRADLDLLAASPEVVAIYPDRMYKPLLNSSQPSIGADDTSAAGFDGQGWAVAVLDTGTDKAHSTFGNRVVDEACFSLEGDCPGGTTSLTGPGAGVHCTSESVCFHGTHVSGIAAGENSTYPGIAPGADIVAVNIFSQVSGVEDCGVPGTCLRTFTSDIISGLQFVRSQANANVAAINLSFGGGEFTSVSACDADDPPLKGEMNNIRGAAIAPIAAAGNDGFTNALNTPACMSNVISVGAITGVNGVWTGSNSASFLDLLAPGVSIRSSVPPALAGNQWQDATGTSMAAPHVAGAFAAIRTADPSISVNAAIQALANTGTPVFDSRNGITKPRIRLDLAIQTVASGNCFNGLDDDFDGNTDFPQDTGCLRGNWVENPACQDGLDNDNDGATDHPADPQCTSSFDQSEATSVSCGLGGELAVILPALWQLRRLRSLRRG